jgi:hypothetical protein
MEIPYGYCHCGCGAKTNISRSFDERSGAQKGEPFRFVRYHVNRGRNGERNANWKGGIMTAGEGAKYLAVYSPDHPQASQNHVLAHILVAESVLGHLLPPGAVVHHIDGNTRKNANSNLVICQDQAYHVLLHRREIALRDCGHASWRKCWICHEYDDINNMRIRQSQSTEHVDCANDYRRSRERRAA